MGNCEEELPKKPVGRLSVNCWPSVDRQVTDSLPTANQQVTDRLRKKINCGKSYLNHTENPCALTDPPAIVLAFVAKHGPVDLDRFSSAAQLQVAM